MIAQKPLRRYPSHVRKNTRLPALRALLSGEGPPCLLVTTPANVRYLTGLDASEALLLVTPRAATLFVDARYAEAAATLRTPTLRVADRKAFEAAMKKIPRCGFEANDVSAERAARWKSTFKNTKFIHVSGLTEGLRRKKDPDEFAAMKHALSITDDVLASVPAMLVRGVTERELAARIQIAMLERGADGTAFDSIVAFGPNSSLPHHRPGRRRLRSRDIVQIDIGAKVDGYCADRSEVFFVGAPTREQRAAYDAVAEAKARAKRALKAGARCADLDAVARRAIEERGFPPYEHALGHGLGLDIHEGPVLSARSKDALAAGYAVTLEPGIYLPGKFGIRLEETLFVK